MVYDYPDDMKHFAVFVCARGMYNEQEFRCAWLGHARYQCGKCKLGYFNAPGPANYDSECPECKAYVVVKWQGDYD